MGDDANTTSAPKFFEYPISGVKVQFPVKPYPSQMAMMSKIIKGLQNGEHCLLESPTGSGKSLALLCAALAWVKDESEKVKKYNDLIDQGIVDLDVLQRISGFVTPEQRQVQKNLQKLNPQSSSSNDTSVSDLNISKPTSQTATKTTPNLETSVGPGGFIPGDIADDLDDFQTPNPNFRIPSINSEFDETVAVDPESYIPRPKKKRVPKIFFGTRTHKQIAQIVKEFRRTPYKDVKSVCLGSREHMCVHPTVSISKAKNEECKKLINADEGGDHCSFHSNLNRLKNNEVWNHKELQEPCDIEDLTKFGKKRRACPYFFSRFLMETADVIFCPYNYIIDPIIRKSMNLSIANEVLILDEAHNIEDSSREALSYSVSHDALIEGMNDLEKLGKFHPTPQLTILLSEMLSSICNWMDTFNDRLTDYATFDRSSKILTGTEMIAHLNNLGISEEKLLGYVTNFIDLTKDENPEEKLPKPSAATCSIFEKLFLCLKFLFANNMEHSEDFKVALIKNKVYKKNRPKPNDGTGWIRKRGSSNQWEYTLNFWCLNPGVNFHEIGNAVRSIILTSGTLAPMSSFQSELGIPFKIQLEANHVISKRQVWVGSIASGPSNLGLTVTFRNTETFQFQDEMGSLVLKVCQTVPKGVLCFFPSYAMLDKMMSRWRDTGMLQKIEDVKYIFSEPRRADEFDETINGFYESIIAASIDKKREDSVPQTGGLFMAVCRGKVSEGIDFTDNNARAVIAVGIPFPNVKDIQVDLKRKYNNHFSASKGLLNGDAWYEIQAFRALNQALGRCIRHRYDWGAIILVDQRYQKGVENKYTKGLSKWVRSCLQHQPNFSYAMEQLDHFVEEMLDNPPLPVLPKLVEKCSTPLTCDNSKKNEKSVAQSPSCSSRAKDPTKVFPIFITPTRTPKPKLSREPAESFLNETIIVEKASASKNDIDFFDMSDDLKMPLKVLPVTSTQISSTIPEIPEAKFIPITSTQIPDSDAVDKSPFITASQLSSQILSQTGGASPTLVYLESDDEPITPLSKKRCLNDVSLCKENKSKFFDTVVNERNKSPVKQVLIKTNCDKTMKSGTSASNNISENSNFQFLSPTKEQKPGWLNTKRLENENKGEKSRNKTPIKLSAKKKTNSSVNFDGLATVNSDDDLFVVSPLKNNQVDRRKDRVTPVKKLQKENKDLKVSSNKSYSRNTDFDDDSDLEDFDLNSSICQKSPVIIRKSQPARRRSSSANKYNLNKL